MNLTDILEGYSKAMYSSWLYYAPDRILFDAGEGVASRMENRAFAIRRVCLTHGHLDHISGLPTLVHIRMAGMGEKTLPLDVYYPNGDSYVEGLREHIERAMGRKPFDLRWHAIGPDARIPLTAADDDPPRQHERWLETFATEHSRGRLTLGYRVVEHRHRLRREFIGRPQDEIRNLVKEVGRDAITERYDHRLLACLGDCVPMEPSAFADTDILLHEATFIDAADREALVHSTLNEAICSAKAAGAGQLVLYHISTRYPRKRIRAEVVKALKEADYPLDKAWLLYEWRLDRADTL